MIPVTSVITLISVVSITYGSRDGLFDDDLYNNVLNPELCRQQLASMRAFECKLLNIKPIAPLPPTSDKKEKNIHLKIIEKKDNCQKNC